MPTIRFLQLLGFDQDDLAAGALKWTDLSPPEEQANDAKVLKAIRATGIARPWEKEFFRKDGSRVPVLIGAAAYGVRELRRRCCLRLGPVRS